MNASMKSTTVVSVTLDETTLTIEQVCRHCAVSPQWLQERIGAGLLAREADARPVAPDFDAQTLARIRLMARLERDFDAVPELAALVADLHDEIARLRARLTRAGQG